MRINPQRADPQPQEDLVEDDRQEARRQEDDRAPGVLPHALPPISLTLEQQAQPIANGKDRRRLAGEDGDRKNDAQPDYRPFPEAEEIDGKPIQTDAQD